MAPTHLDINSPTFKQVILYELVCSKDNGSFFSPNTYKSHLALGYKRIPFKIVPLTFLEVTEKIPKVLKSASNVLSLPSGESITVPVIYDPNTDTVVQDSWRIAEYLDDTYPEVPILHDQPNLQLLLHDIIMRGPLHLASSLVLMDVVAKLDPPNAEYFRTTREKMFGKTLEQTFATTSEERVATLGKLRRELIPYRKAIGRSGGFLGDKANAGHVDFFFAGMLNLCQFASEQSYREIFLVLEDGTQDNTLHDYFLRMQAFAQSP